jgi:hypothetical protein
MLSNQKRGVSREVSTDSPRLLIQSLMFFRYTLKGTVSRDFLLLVLFMNQFPPQPQSIPLRPFRIFSKIRGDIRSSRFATGNDTGGKGKKSSIRKILIIVFGHLWVEEEFASKFTFRCLQPDIVPIICHRCR